jgi:hypothetical protein
MWGSAPHDIAKGVHRPLTATVLAINPEAVPPVYLASLDWGWWRSSEDEWFLRGAILEELGLEESQLLIHLSHTHSGPSISLQAQDKPGGELIRPYLESVRDRLLDTIVNAQRHTRAATITWHQGRCQLACCRDQRLSNEGKTIVGYSPQAPADDTLVVGRVVSDEGGVLATLVNYACHPTTLGSANALISPDYVGATREVVEAHTGNAPCIFLLGAAGDLAPRRQYKGEVDVAEQNGRQLGYAVLATLEDMLPSGKRLVFQGTEESTARLGHWALADDQADGFAAFACSHLTFPLARSRSEGAAGLGATQDRASLERMERMLQLWCGHENSESASVKVWIHRFGDAVFVAVPGEMHSVFQTTLRRRFSEHTIVVVNLVNGMHGYFPPLEDFQEHTYQCQTTLYEPGAYEAILEKTSAAIENLLQPVASGASRSHSTKARNAGQSVSE